ncbi:MAG TPA: alpha/beta hydrolase [Allosphingosinicella sp.]|jgi:pimeloyl-ACP methyl ester carboxylesterase|nr:alpha/beta hydrolase [Allosphingosinicella sp.]
MARTIVFIHGAWVTPRSWNVFRAPFDAAGYDVRTPAWPQIGEHEAAELNADPPAGFGGLSIVRIADHLQAMIEALPEKPILLGHSFGGLLTQMLLDRGVGAAGIALNPAPIGGLVPGPSAWRAIAPILLRPNGWNRPYEFTRERFGRLFANAAPPVLVDQAYERYVIPAPGKIFHQAAFWSGTRVDPGRRTQPLLITGGTEDRLISLHLSRAAYRRQRRAPARTDYAEFPGRSHFLIAEPGWEDVAGHALSWIDRQPGS